MNRILEISEGYNSVVINCIHRIARELIRKNGEFAKEINPKCASISGIRSMCYQSSIMLIEECLLRYDTNESVFQALSGCEKPIINENTKEFWIALTKVYEKMGDSDAVKGLWLQIVQENSTELGEKIKKTLDLKTCGSLREAVQGFKSILQECTDDLAKEIKSEYLESLAYLGKWMEVKNEIEQTNTLKIKSYMRLNEFAELTDVVKILPSASLYTRYPYEMSLLNITQDDPDRAKYYLDQEFSRFVEK